MIAEKQYTKESVPIVRELISRTGKEGYAEAELMAVRKDGSTFPVIAQGSALKDKSGNVTHLIFAITDLSEIKRVQAFTEALIRKVPVPMSIMDVSGKRVDVNETFEKLYLYSRKDAIGLSIEKLYAKEDVPKLLKAIEICKKEGYSTCEVRTIRGDGVEMPVLLNFSVIRDENGNVINIGIVLIYTA